MAAAYRVTGIDHLSVSADYYRDWRFSDARSAQGATSDRDACGGIATHRCNRSRR